MAAVNKREPPREKEQKHQTGRVKQAAWGTFSEPGARSPEPGAPLRHLTV